MTPASADDLVAHARATRVVIVGGGLAGLVAALECAKVGLSVTVFEDGDRFGGAIAAANIDGVRLDVGDDAFRPGGAEFDALLAELDLAGAVSTPARTDVRIATAAGPVPVPADSVLGIPANAWADDVRRIIGSRGAWRAYLDRLRPPLTIGREERLGALVRSRLGDRVADLLVDPVARGVHGIDADALDTDAAVPGLSTALTRAGSLGGGVGQVLEEQPPLPPRASLEGGMTRLVDSLVARLADLGAELRPATRVTAVRRDGDGYLVAAETTADGADTDGAPAIADGDPGADLRADVVIAAAGAAETARLFATVASDAAAGAGSAGAAVRTVVTMVVNAPELDGAPHGRAVFAGGAARLADAVAHSSAEWEWLAGALGAGRHVLRIALADHSSDAGAVSDNDAVARATAAAAAMLAPSLTADRVVAAHVDRRRVGPPASALGRAAAADAVRSAVQPVPGLGVVGAWIAGHDPADVVADAVAEAERLRRGALWGPGSAQPVP